jgi:RimJ/RimL family protein N-acetyltransferase
MLNGKQVILTSLRPGDSETLFKWINDPELVRNNAPFAPVHYPNHRSWFESVASRANTYIFAIRANDVLIGTCQLFDVHPVHRSAEFQIRIGDSNFRGRGYGTDAVRTCLRFAQSDAGLHSVWLRTFANNEPAIRCYEKAGMTRCGVLREFAFIDGAWVDVAFFQVVFQERGQLQR